MADEYRAGNERVVGGNGSPGHARCRPHQPATCFLGTLSPFAIKLQQKEFPKKGIGSITGEIYFWSTLGSIFGSLFTGFVLIPQFGINHIIISVAVILTVLGLLPLLKTGFPNKTFLIVILLTCSAFFLTKFYPYLEKAL
jgi:hypothetical protein